MNITTNGQAQLIPSSASLRTNDQRMFELSPLSSQLIGHQQTQCGAPARKGPHQQYQSAPQLNSGWEMESTCCWIAQRSMAKVQTTVLVYLSFLNCVYLHELAKKLLCTGTKPFSSKTSQTFTFSGFAAHNCFDLINLPQATLTSFLPTVLFSFFCGVYSPATTRSNRSSIQNQHQPKAYLSRWMAEISDPLSRRTVVQFHN